MDDIFAVIIPLLLFGGGGWVLGIIGFFRAESAQRQIRALERRLATLAAAPRPAAFVAPPPPVTPDPVVAKPVVAEPVGPPLQAALPEPIVAEPVLAAAPPASKPKRDIEALLTLRWGVWLGAAALLFAGIFLIRYAVDAGLLGPGVRCCAGALLGAALVAMGEVALRRSHAGGTSPVGLTDQVPAALTAGGLAVLFGAAYGAGPLYGLVPPPIDFVMLAAVGLGGLALSLRQGQLVAAVGLVGAFATPLLVAGDAALGGLFLYLLVVTATALAVVRLTAWTWLGWAAIAAGGGYVLVVLPTVTAGQAWAPASYVAVAAALHVGLLPGAALDFAVGRRLAWVPFAVLGLCGLLLCGATNAWTAYAAVLLLAPVAIAKGAVEPRLDRLPWLAALFCLAVLRIMDLPPWRSTGETISVEGRIVGMLPGAWVPPEIAPLLWVAALIAVVFALAGLAMERRAPQPARWAALTAAVPVLCLALTFLQVRGFQSDGIWAAEAVLLAGGLVAAAAVAREPARAGVHAAGAVAALALGCAMLLAEYWLTLALALFLPGLAWVEAQARLPALRRVAIVVAGVVLARLLLNFYVLDYAFGSAPVANGLLAAYGAPALAFAVAAWMFGRGGTDLAVAVLQAGAVALTTVFVAAEIHHALHGGALDTRDVSFLEAGLHVSAGGILALAVMRIAGVTPSRVLEVAWRLLGGLSVAGGVALIVLNPTIIDVTLEPYSISPSLFLAYCAPAVLAAIGVWKAPLGRRMELWLGAYGVVALFAWLSLEVRHEFHPTGMEWLSVPVADAELWAWSGVWLAYGAALLAGGIRLGNKPLRLSALAIIALTAGKVFLIDMAGLVGLWRVLSFLGLGLALIGLGAVYRRFVVTEPVAK